jgi:hypothetical protein
MAHIDTPQESFVHHIAEIFTLGLAMSDAICHLTRGRGRTVKIAYDGQEWLVETRDAPRLWIKMTLIE